MSTRKNEKSEKPRNYNLKSKDGIVLVSGSQENQSFRGMLSVLIGLKFISPRNIAIDVVGDIVRFKEFR